MSGFDILRGESLMSRTDKDRPYIIRSLGH